MKLSTIWYRANRELTQIRGEFGSRSAKRACAVGAIFYYDAKNPAIDDLSRYDWKDMKQEETLLKARDVLTSATGKDIVELNDREGWTFLQFARKARSLGL